MSRTIRTVPPLREFAVPGGLEPSTVQPAWSGRAEAAVWRVDELAAISAHLAERGPAVLAAIPLERRAELWLDSVAALLEPESDERRSLIPALVDSSRLSPEGLSEALEVVVGGAGARAVEALLGRLPAATPRPLAAVVLAANVPALAVQSVLPALLLGRPLLVRSSPREPLFAPALVDALVRREPLLADAFAALAWPGGATELENAAFTPCARIVAYGGAAALAALAARCGGRLVAHGPRASVAAVAGALDPVTACRALARDIALLDQRGCLSVQAVYTTGDAHELGEVLAFALEAEHARLPPGPIDAATAAAVHQLRGTAELSDALIGGLDLDAGSVIVAANGEFRPVPGLRTVRLHRVADLGEMAGWLLPWRGRLQGIAWVGDVAAAGTDRLSEQLDLARVAPAGRLQHAEAGWRSGGIDPLVALA